MTILSMYQLKQYANKFLKENYNLTLSIPLELNGRMTKTYGWFKHKRGRKEPVCVQLNKYFVENNEPVVVLDVLRHELVHYALYMLDRPYRDGDAVFEGELKRLGVISQNNVNKYDIESKPRNLSIHIYRCAVDKCRQEYKRRRALPNQGRGHRCQCGGRLMDLGKKTVATA